MNVLCTQCKKIYKLPDKAVFPTKLLFAIILGSISVTLFKNQMKYDFNIFIITIAVASLIGAILFGLSMYKNQWNCTECNCKNSLIKIDTSEAIEIIKKNNLSFPKDDQEGSKLPWQTS